MFPLKSAATAKVLNCWISPSWECDNQEDIDRYSENDCQFSYDEENEVYTAVLKNADGDTLEVEGDECDFKGMAVAIEIAGTGVKHDEK